MDTHRNPPKAGGALWSANHPSVWRETLADESGRPISVLLRHPSYPFTDRVARSDGIAALRAVANRYLQLAQARAGISDEVLDALLRPKSRPEFGWLPLTWGPGKLEQARDARGSFRMARELPGAGASQTLVMLAGYRMQDLTSAGGEVGLRLALHLDARPRAARWNVRITGLCTSRLPQGFKASRPLDPMSARLQGRIVALATALDFQQWAVDGMAFVDPAQDDTLRVFLSGAKPSADGVSQRNFRLVADFPPNGAEPKVVQRSERLSHAVPASVFELDPASCTPAPAPIETRRPTRPDTQLDGHRICTPHMEALLKHASGAFEVRQTPLGNVAADATQPQRIVPGTLPLRSDALAAAHAFLRGDELLRRLTAYGLLAANYFRLVKLPLLLRHRAPLKGAGDGIAVNAQVRPLGVGAGIYPQLVPGVVVPGEMPELAVSFGWCELAHRQRHLNDGNRVRAQPLGLAADARWAWHEFGHVLNYANLGELEFGFAHSAGDALAAIVADPESRQVRAGTERGLTFPWAFIPRRHDRDAMAGWCWCGRRSLSRQPRTGDNAPRELHLGYFEEQLLSSSLFRLYRCIGGDSLGADACHGAADYVVYLVMGAIQFLGLQAVAPVHSADQFVWALIETDLGAGAWNISATWPEHRQPRTLRRVGGCVHKVIRWAFEQQGLYATQLASATAEGPGLPPQVDIYIPDRRLGSQGQGGYHPVPLSAPSAMPPPQWQAGAAGIARASAGKVVVRVRNRGRQAADAVTVRCWVKRVNGGNVDDPNGWTELAATAGSQPASVGLISATSFRFDLPVGNAALQGPHWVKASATCPADPSNLDPLAAMPLAGMAVPITDLVANDNNLGLRRLRF